MKKMAARYLMNPILSKSPKKTNPKRSRRKRFHRQQRDKDQRKRSRSKSQPKESHKRKKVRAGKGPTDSDIEKTYTGMDRDLAEEFIEQTMEPNGAGTGDQTVSGTESEAW